MNATFSLSKTRGIKNLILRITSIFRRFGFSSKGFESKLDRYSKAARSMGCKPTFGITAVTLARHPSFIKKLSEQGTEIAVHGYIHTDYGMLSAQEQTRHFKKAIKIFQDCRIPFVGFRAPYLRINGTSPETLFNLGFTYDSSHPIHWKVIERSQFPENLWGQYNRLLEYYKHRNSNYHLALPRLINRFIEIPVSIPDDEMLIDRLDIKDNEEISRIWGSILKSTYDGGELFTMSFHPERIENCEDALLSVLRQAGDLTPHVWVATLQEIAGWWSERDNFSFEVIPEGKNMYRVKAHCSDAATILIKNCKVDAVTTDWSYGYRAVNARDFMLESPLRPFIGVSPSASAGALKFLKSEGFMVEQSTQPQNYGIYLSNLHKFQEIDEKPFSRLLEKSAAPHIRFWRWPESAKSALSVTGDIDSITLIDFGLRIVENFVQSLKGG